MGGRGVFIGVVVGVSVNPCSVVKGTDLLGFGLGFRALRRGCIVKVGGFVVAAVENIIRGL